MKADLIITNGLVVDGTGLPRRRADVAIADGRILAIGQFEPSDADRVLDAGGRIVAPGIIDPHTHYDPQLTFEPYGTSSCFHGVTSVITGNCGFSVAPARAGDRNAICQVFERVEDMSPGALAGIPWNFESFPEFLRAREGRLGINAGFYIGHCNVRRWVLGDDATEREATTTEIEAMCALVREAMDAGAAGLSSTHAPTHFDSLDRPVPSRLATRDELKALVSEVGHTNRGSVSYLPHSSIGGLDQADRDLLIELALASRLPIIIQGLGARSKVDAPTATWDESRKYLERARSLGAGVYSMLMARPFNRRFSLAGGTSLFEGAHAFHRLFTEASSVEDRVKMLSDDTFRDSIRNAVENPNKDSTRGSTLPPPHFDALYVYRGPDAIGEHSIAEIAAKSNVAPMDAFIELALAEGLETEFIWRTETPEWKRGTHAASVHPHMIIGTSDGGAHLGRDDGADFSSYFFANWVREWGLWELEEAVRQLTQQMAALLGIRDRGMLIPGLAADIMIFDPDSIGPGTKEFVRDFPNGEGRWSSRPTGVFATIVNGVPIALEGQLVEGCGLPGQILRPT